MAAKVIKQPTRNPRRSFPAARPPTAHDAGEQLITAEAVAERLGMDRDTVYLWVQQGKIEYVKLGSSTRFKVSSVERMIREHTIPPIEE